ncbi:glycerol-3-phosphate 1-O-acyltransferase PlsB [Marinihelvus fidelis]|uniref:Glycerol-3-phosphate acyltransferase n=1 Tax=Marinihelvus fidelis TaxID=2613842 RepID=A0A5N0T7U9_9GAMM|nr:glycerol-3-phosphate 1-O-acyltransferase PlsB [Marinihelvus fidelis]KAA9131000.1 glycerol-3-phosphate 1-O-acyltransferase PlsB [Marinihelvus fidelis]
MPQSLEHLGFSERLKLRGTLLLRAILHWWVKAQVLPDAEGETGVQPGPPVCYVIADYALSSVLILDRVCEQQGLDRPLFPIAAMEASEPRAYAALRRASGLFVRRTIPRRGSETLGRLVQACYDDPSMDVLLVPVTVLVGRAPDKSEGFYKTLFSEDWALGGRIRRFMSTLVNGRDTVVQFSRPISLRQLADERAGAARDQRKVSRILRTHFRRVKSAVIGPDLSHRRTLIETVVHAPAVRAAIAEKTERDDISEAEAADIAREYAVEIAANYSYTFVRVMFFVLNWFLQKVYGDTRVYHFDRFKREAPGHEIIYVPCHRSHADYILISFLLYVRGFAVPHIAAGVNLNLPVVGRFLRMGGAFFLRRTFRSQKLYSAVFSEYVSHILAQGTPIEYFIEGTRSRTGRLLPPKGGMLAMTIRGYLRAPVRPVMFQPLYIGYEKLLDGAGYNKELAGAVKKKETLWDLLGSWRILRRRHGEAHVSFGEPIFLDRMLDEENPDWRAAGEPGEKPAWMTPFVNRLGDRVMRAINTTADVNPINLLSTVLLATPRHALGEQALRDQVELYRSILAAAPLGEQVTVTPLDGIDMVSRGFELDYLQRVEHPLGDIIRLQAEQAVNLTYYRNNTAHLFAIPSLIACCFLRQRGIATEQLVRVARQVYPFLRAELFLPWSEEAFPDVLEQYISALEAHGLLFREDEGRRIKRAEGGSGEASQLLLLARSLLTTLERYFIAVAVLVKNGSGTLNRQELERLCIMTAQRISLIQEFEAPEFYDKGLFRQFIGELRRRDILVVNDQERLEFGDALDRMSKDARLFLEKGIRHGIIQAAPQALGRNP